MQFVQNSLNYGKIMKIKFPKISLENIKAVMIDLDDTLYCYEPAHLLALKECYQEEIASHYSYDDFVKQYRKARNTVMNRIYPQGACRSRLFAFQKLFEDKKISQPFQLANKFEEIYWDSLIENIILEKDAEHFLTTCKAHQIKVCIVTDMLANIQIKKIKKLGLTKYVDYLVTSEEVGVEKPDPAIFNLALYKLQASPKDVIMVGDSLDKDIMGAKNLGIIAYKVEHLT